MEERASERERDELTVNGGNSSVSERVRERGAKRV
jgi:hypothetical protein